MNRANFRNYANEERAATPDIVERVRKVAGNGYGFGTKNVVMLEAADEIERLRRVVEDLRVPHTETTIIE